MSARAGQAVAVRSRLAVSGWAPGRIESVEPDGTLRIRIAAERLVCVHPGAIRTHVRLHPKANARRRARAQAYRDLGMVRTPYGWE